MKVKVEFKEFYCNGVSVRVVLAAAVAPIGRSYNYMIYLSLYLIHQNQSAWLTALHADHPAAI